MPRSLLFVVPGCPVPKQSFRSTRRGFFTDSRTRQHQDQVRLYAMAAVSRHLGGKKLEGRVELHAAFWLPDRRRVDIDNLSKCLLDGMKNEVFADDSVVCRATLEKDVDRGSPRTLILCTELEDSWRARATL